MTEYSSTGSKLLRVAEAMMKASMLLLPVVRPFSGSLFFAGVLRDFRLGGATSDKAVSPLGTGDTDKGSAVEFGAGTEGVSKMICSLEVWGNSAICPAVLEDTSLTF